MGRRAGDDRRPSSRRRGLLVAAVLAGAAVAGALWWWPARPRTTLPAPPDTSRQTRAVAEHINARYGAAREHPGPMTIGALCRAYYADMFFDAADACYASLERAEPSNWEWTYWRALIRDDRGGGAELVKELQSVVASRPDFAPAWLRLGDAMFKLGDYDGAANAWGRATTLGEPEPAHDEPPHVPEAPLAAYASLGVARVAVARGDVGSARMILHEVVDNVPDFGPAWRLLADTYGDDPQPIAQRALYVANHLPPFAPYADPFVDALARESRNSTFLLRMASNADLGKNAAWSEYLTRRALEFDPDNPDVVSKLGRVLRTLGRNEEALKYFQRYNALVPGDFQGLAQTGSCLSALGRYADAEPLLRRALPHLDDATTHYNLALLLAHTDRLDEAKSEYRAALARDAAHVDARINLAAALAQTGDLDGAATELRRVVALDPDNALAHANLGLVLTRRHSPAAAAELRRAHELDPSLKQEDSLTP